MSITLRRTFLILSIAAAGMGALLALLPAAGHDQLWFLLMARRWTGGAILYGPEIFDSNPPGIVWLSAVPVWLGQGLHLPATAVAKLLVVLAEGASAALSYRFLRPARRACGGNFEPFALLFGCVALFLLVPARDLGQRDQLLSFLVLPYVLAAAIPFRQRPLILERFVAGIMAAAGFCLKPQYALIPIALEATVLLQPAESVRARLRRLLRPEPLLIALGGAIYLLAIRHFTPLYFSVALPLLRETYWAVGHLSMGALALEAIEMCVLATLSIGLFFFARRRSTTVGALLIAGIAAAAAYFFQGTGWYYQQIPAIVLIGAGLWLQLIDLGQRFPLPAPRWLAPAAGALSVLALALSTHFMGYPFTQDRAFAIESPDPALFSGLAPGTAVAMLTTSVDATMMPVERYHLEWAQRTNNLWLLPAVLRSESSATGRPPQRGLPAADLAALEVLERRWMVDDLARWRPQLVLVERCQDAGIRCQLLEDRNDDLLGWFLRDPAFAAAWQRFHWVRRDGRFDVYAAR